MKGILSTGGVDREYTLCGMRSRDAKMEESREETRRRRRRRRKQLTDELSGWHEFSMYRVVSGICNNDSVNFH